MDFCFSISIYNLIFWDYHLCQMSNMKRPKQVQEQLTHSCSVSSSCSWWISAAVAQKQQQSSQGHSVEILQMIGTAWLIWKEFKFWDLSWVLASLTQIPIPLMREKFSYCCHLSRILSSLRSSSICLLSNSLPCFQYWMLYGLIDIISNLSLMLKLEK